jgi:hypothetical protein
MAEKAEGKSWLVNSKYKRRERVYWKRRVGFAVEMGVEGQRTKGRDGLILSFCLLVKTPLWALCME